MERAHSSRDALLNVSVAGRTTTFNIWGNCAKPGRRLWFVAMRVRLQNLSRNVDYRFVTEGAKKRSKDFGANTNSQFARFFGISDEFKDSAVTDYPMQLIPVVTHGNQPPKYEDIVPDRRPPNAESCAQSYAAQFIGNPDSFFHGEQGYKEGSGFKIPDSGQLGARALDQATEQHRATDGRIIGVSDAKQDLLKAAKSAVDGPLGGALAIYSFWVVYIFWSPAIIHFVVVVVCCWQITARCRSSAGSGCLETSTTKKPRSPPGSATAIYHFRPCVSGGSPRPRARSPHRRACWGSTTPRFTLRCPRSKFW